jgi:Bacterial Ig-like domain (group 3)
VPGDPFQFNAASAATSNSPVGQYLIVPFITGANISRYTVNAVNGTLTVTQAGSTAALASSSLSVTFGASVTFTATIASATTGTPTGSVQFLDGATSLGSAPLNAQGVAALIALALLPGSHPITAKYLGDLNFNGSLSPAISQQVIALGPDFAVAASASTATVRAGGSATFTFTVTPVGGFNQSVSFSCAGLPALSQCAFVPSTVTPNGSPVTSVLTITTTAPTAALAPPPFPRNNLPLYAGLSGAIFGMVWITCSSRKRGKINSTLRLLGALWLLTMLTSCGGAGGQRGGGQPGTPAGTTQISVMATTGTTTHTSSVTLVVTN